MSSVFRACPAKEATMFLYLSSCESMRARPDRADHAGVGERQSSPQTTTRRVSAIALLSMLVLGVSTLTSPSWAADRTDGPRHPQGRAPHGDGMQRQSPRPSFDRPAPNFHRGDAGARMPQAAPREPQGIQLRSETPAGRPMIPDASTRRAPEAMPAPRIPGSVRPSIQQAAPIAPAIQGERAPRPAISVQPAPRAAPSGGFIPHGGGGGARFSPPVYGPDLRRAAPGFRPPHGVSTPAVRWSFDTRHGHSHFYPRPGYQVSALPHRHHPIFHRNEPYFFYSGIWYRPAWYGYTVVRPPLGILVPLLPSYYSTIWIGGTRYYYANDVYYLPAAGGYTVVEAPSGTVSRVEPAQPASPASATGPFADGTWYWCQGAGAYYPYVSDCEDGWEPVPAVPADLGGSAASFAQGTWYWCDESGSYYPYQNACPGGWRAVPASPPVSDSQTPRQ